MPNTPLLGITQVSASQNSKEVTINDAILALENATNAVKEVSFAASTSVLLTGLETTRAFIFVAQSATADSTLRFPNTINTIDVSRIVAVRNESGHGLLVKFNTGAGSTVTIPNNQTRLLALMNGLNVIVAAEPSTVVDFLSLTDTPNSYAGQTGKVLAVNLDEDELEFIDVAVFPTLTGQAGKYLVVKGDESGVEWVDASVAAAFTDLTDVPSDYTDAAGKVLAVNEAETGVEFIDLPEAEAVEYIVAARWRIFIVEPGSETQAGFGEVEFLDIDGINLVGTGAAVASTFATGKEAEFAFNGSTLAGEGWLTEEDELVDQWIEYEFDDPVTVRTFRLSPITDFPEYTPERIRIEYFDGADWIPLGDRTTGTWIEATAKTFKVNGVPLSSLTDAPADGDLYARRDNLWESFTAGVDALADLTDVDVTTAPPSDGDVLTWNNAGSEWIPEPPVTGLTDAPSDGEIYGRKDGAWEVVAPTAVFSAVQTEAADYTIDPADVGNYIRLTDAGAKTVTVAPNSTTALPANGEWHFRNVGAGDATFDEGSGVTIHAPNGGTLVVPAGGTVTLKRVATDEFDLMGQTVAV